MYKILVRLSIIYVVIFIFKITSYADTYELNDLIENGKEYDKRIVIVQGEAIGDLMKRKNNAWININDKTNSMGIYMDLKDSEQIKILGDYKHKGDIIKVEGLFNRACKEHGGDMDIHANSVELVQKGEDIHENINLSRKKISIILSGFTVLIAGLYYKLCRE